MQLEKTKKSEWVSVTQYVKVTDVTKNSVIGKNRDGQNLEICGKKLIELCNSGSQFANIVKLGKHDIAHKLQNAGDKVFTVCYKKQDGTERVLTGYLVSVEPNLGRTQVVDLEIPADDRTKGLRLVDNREIKYLILENVKYTSK